MAEERFFEQISEEQQKQREDIIKKLTEQGPSPKGAPRPLAPAIPERDKC